MSKIILIFTLTAMAVSARAQSIFGLSGGVNFSHFTTTFENTGVTKRKIMGVFTGVYFDIERTEKTAIRPELHFIQKGFIRETPLGDRLYRLNYLDLAVLFKYRFVNLNKRPKKRKQLHAYLMAGPFLGYSGSGKIKNTETGETFPYDFNGGVSLKHMDAGMTFAGGLELPIGNGYLVTDLRYNLGILRLNTYGSSGDAIKNYGIIPNIGYGFLLGR
jgi:hypothetical protein